MKTWLRDNLDGEQFPDRLRAAAETYLPGRPVGRKHLPAFFRQGMSRAFDDANRQKSVLERLGGGYLYFQGQKHSLLSSVAASPDANSSLDRILSQFALDTDSVLASAVAGITRVVMSISESGTRRKHQAALEELEKALTRGRAAAITAAAGAFSLGQYHALSRLGVRRVGFRVDDDACPRCSPYRQRVVPLGEAKGLLPLHPNCLCAMVPR